MRTMSPLLTVAIVRVSADAAVATKAMAEQAPSKKVFNVISSSREDDCEHSLCSWAITYQDLMEVNTDSSLHCD
ncbi:hypothetical protein D3C80_798530 [compost metagenome]